MPLGVFLNPNFTLEEAHAFHKKHHDAAMAKLDNLQAEHKRKLAEIEECGAAAEAMGHFADLERGDGEAYERNAARQLWIAHALSEQECFTSIWSVQIMFALL